VETCQQTNDGRDEKKVNLWNPIQRASLTVVSCAPQAETSIPT